MFVLLLVLVCSTSYAKNNFQWWYAVRVSSLDSLLKQAMQVEEVKQIYNACKQDLELFLPYELSQLNWEKFSNNDIFWAVGKSNNRVRQKVWILDKNDNVIAYYNDSNIFMILAQNQGFLTNEGQKPKDLPDIFYDFNSDNILHFRIFQNSFINQLEEALKNDLQRSILPAKSNCRLNIRKLEREVNINNGLDLRVINKRMPCPLDGSYSYNYELERFVCDHEIKEPDYASKNLNDVQNQLFSIIKLLKNISDIEYIVENTLEKHQLMISFNKAPDKGLYLPTSVNQYITWFNNTHELDRFSPRSTVNILAYPRIQSIIEGILQDFFYTQKFPDYYNQILNDLKTSESMLSLSIIGNFDLYDGHELPSVNVNTEFDNNHLNKFLRILKTLNPDVSFASTELFGREISVLKLFDHSMSFNRHGEVDNNIYIALSDEGYVFGSLGAKAITKQLKLNCGEETPVALWYDIDTPLKIAVASRMDLVAGFFLNLINQKRFRIEMQECRTNLSRWQQHNRRQSNSLCPDEPLDDEIQKLCNRDGIIVDARHRRLSCAVHNHHAAMQARNIYYNADFDTNRWLRVYVTKDNNMSRLVIDVKKGKKVK